VDRSELTISPDCPVAFVDVETTGCAPGRDRVIDVAVIGARGGEVEFEWQSLVNPGGRIAAGITALTGIDNDMLVDAPRFEEIAAELRAKLAGRLFVAHNVRFDYGFIRREFAHTGSEWRAPNLCTVRLSRALYPGMRRHNLDALIEHHGFQIEQRHRAMPDARVLLDFWRKLRDEWPAEQLQRALEVSSLRATLPAALPPDLADDLPEAPGVYRFFGADEQGGDTLLYVGKANNLRERVLDYFRAGAHDARSLRLAAQVRRVTWTETAGELGALLLEAREVRELQPVYNRQLRGNGERFTWLFGDAGETPALVEIDAQVLRSGNAFGTWRAAGDARRALESMASERRWCFKLLGLEQGPGSCFGYQVGRCDGACVGREPAAVHLARVKMELMPQRLRQWPHEGPMLYREGAGERTQYHVIDAWQHLGSFDAGDDPAAWSTRGRRSHDPDFNIDSYRILTSHLRNARLTPLSDSTQWGVDDSWS
jgi:DNA polymerase-3 subunit epsilon